MDELTLVKQVRADVTDPDAATLHRIRGEVLSALPRTGTAGRRARHRRLGLLRGHRPALRLAVAAGLAAAIALGTVAVDALVTHDGRPVIGHEAAAELNRAADAAIKAVDPPLAPGQFYYLREVEVASTEIYDGSCNGLFYLHKNVYETWVPKNWNDQWMLRRADDVDRQFLRPGDEARAKACGVGAEPRTSTQVRKAPAGLFYSDGGDPPGAGDTVVLSPSPAEIAKRLAAGGWQEPSPEFMAGLPRDPRTLLDRIYRDSAGHGSGRNDEAFVYIRDVLRSGVVPADLRAALLRAAALIPGIRMVDDSVNLEGRHGVAVAMSDHGQSRIELIFDPATGDVIGEREVVLKEGLLPEVRPGTAVKYTAVSRQIVDAMGTVPAK